MIITSICMEQEVTLVRLCIVCVKLQLLHYTKVNMENMELVCFNGSRMIDRLPVEEITTVSSNMKLSVLFSYLMVLL